MNEYVVGFALGVVVTLMIVAEVIQRRRWKREERQFRSRYGDPGGERCPCGSTYGACVNCPPWRHVPPLVNKEHEVPR